MDYQRAVDFHPVVYSPSITTVGDWFYDLSLWCFQHQIEFEILIVAAMLYAVLEYGNRVRAKRAVAWRLSRAIRGMMMSRKNRELYQLMHLEDAIGDAMDEMLWQGKMTQGEYSEWGHFFADSYNMKGLIPMKDVKRGVKLRLSRLITENAKKKHPKIPGPPPGVEADPSYNGSGDRKKSRFE